MKIVDEIIQDLASHRHSVRIQAFKKVDALQDLGEIKALALKALGSPDNELALIVINKLDQSLNGRKINACTFYIWALNRLIYSRGGVLGTKSKEAIVRFCLDRNISENFKGLCFRFALGDTPYAERAFLLTQVTAQKYYAAVTFLSLGGAVGDVGGSQTAFSHREALADAQYLAYWTSPESAAEQANLEWIRGIWADSFPHVSAGGAGCYVNYCDDDLPDQAWPDLYHGTNLARLRQVKAAYDPTDFFRGAQTIRLP